MDRLDRAAGRLFAAAALIGMAALVAAIGVVAADVVGRRGLGFTVLGTVDLTQLSVMTAAFLAIPWAFHTGAHVRVEIATEAAPALARRALDALALALGVGFMALILWTAWPQAMRVHGWGDVSQDLGLPMIIYWGALLAGCALAALAAALRLVGVLAGRRDG